MSIWNEKKFSPEIRRKEFGRFEEVCGPDGRESLRCPGAGLEVAF